MSLSNIISHKTAESGAFPPFFSSISRPERGEYRKSRSGIKNNVKGK